MFYFNEDGSKVSVEYYSILHDEYFGAVNQFDLVLIPEEPKPVETTAAVTTAAPETTTAAPETTAAPDTDPVSDPEPSEDGASGTVWVIAGIAAAVIIAAAAVIVIRKKKK